MGLVVHKLEMMGGNVVSYNINMSATGKLLCARNQRNIPVVYYTTDLSKSTDNWVEIRGFHTGQEQMTAGWKYLDTVMLDDGDYVLHIFYRNDDDGLYN